MIAEFVEKFQAHKAQLWQQFYEHPPCTYLAIVEAVVGILGSGERYSRPDPTNIQEFGAGDYQGTATYLIGSTSFGAGWVVAVNYGSCSGCDTLEALRDYHRGPPTTKKVDGYLQLALHIVQAIREIESADFPGFDDE